MHHSDNCFTSRMKKFLAIVSGALLALSSFSSASAAAPAATVWSRYHVSIAAVNGSATDSSSLKFEGIETGFDFDISAVPTDTKISFGLEETSGKNLTVGTGCCVTANIDDDKTMPSVSWGGGTWDHMKLAGEKVAHIRFINNYDEFKDGKYVGKLGAIPAHAWVQIGAADKVVVNSSNSQKYYLTYEFMSYSKTLTVPAKYSQLWVETMWDAKATVAKGKLVSFKAPSFTIKAPGGKTSKVLKYTVGRLGLSLAAYTDAKYQEAKGSSLTVENDGSHVYANWGAYLANGLKAGSTIAITMPVITVK